MSKILLPGEEGKQDLTPGEVRAWEDEFNQHRTHVPTLWIVHKKNPWFKIGTRVRRYRDGYEEVLMDKNQAVGHPEDHPYDGHKVIEHRLLAPYIMAILKRGLDSGSARQDRQRAMSAVGEY